MGISFFGIHRDVRCKYQRPATTDQWPATRSQRPGIRSKRPETSNKRLRWLAFVSLILFLARASVAAEIPAEQAAQFKETIQDLSSLTDRSTGTAGNQTAAKYIKDKFVQLGLEGVATQVFSVPVIRYGKSTLTLTDRSLTVPIRPIRANAITPQMVARPGISAPVIYVGGGELHEFNGKTIDGAIMLMELESGKNWQYAANLGARALIYVDRGQSPKIFFEEKVELSPIQFPRFWMPLSQARKLFGDFEHHQDGIAADQANLISDARWESVATENIYGLIPGTDPNLQEQMVMVDAFYDSTAMVAGLSPGADEACSLATLFNLARFLKENPPQRTVLFVASGGHIQGLAGMRELVWSFSARSKDLRQMQRELKALIKKTRKTISALETASFDAETQDASTPSDTHALVKAALEERIKTEADRVSRHLMRLRLEAQAQANKDQIDDLARERQLLRRILWQPNYFNLSEDERRVLYDLIPRAKSDRKAVLADAEQQLKYLNNARELRSFVNAYDVVSAISLHLSSQGDGFGAFNYGWQYPFRPRINRTAIYSRLEEVLRQAITKIEQDPGYAGVFKDTLRPSRRQSWQSYFLDQPALGGEVTALAGIHGLSFVTTHDARAMWGTPHDTPDRINLDFALKQSAVVSRLIHRIAQEPKLHDGIFPRIGFGAVKGRAKFLRHGELFADQPAPGTVLLAYQGPARYHAIVDHMGMFYLKGMADKKHSFHKIIFEGYKFDDRTGLVTWTIDKKQTGKDSYRLKMYRRFMETDLIMFASKGLTLFNLLEPRTFRYMSKGKILDGRREADPLRYFYSRWDTWISNYSNASLISTIFLDPGTPLKLTMSDSPLRKKLILLNADEDNPQGSGYMIENWPFLYRTEYRIARDMWSLLSPRITNLEKRGIFNERIRLLQQEGLTALKNAKTALEKKRYDQFFEASAKSWALASRVYDDVEKTQKDVLYGVLFYIALFVPFAFCLERLIFSYTNIYKRIIAFCSILVLLIVIIYNVHPAFRLAYSPMVVILAFFIMGLSLIVTLIIFFRFEEEMTQLQSRAKLVQSGEIGRWKAFVAAFLLGVSNLRRRRLRTALTCATLIILTFTIMSFTSAKSMRHHARILYDSRAPYQGFLLKNVNWTDLPPEAFSFIANSFTGTADAVPRVWLEDQDRTRSTRIPVYSKDTVFEALGVVGLSHAEPQVSGLDEILVAGRWLAAGDRQAVLLPDRMASKLNIDPMQPQGHAVSLWGMPFRVVGIFSGKKLQERIDLDGEPLTPVTFPREISTEMTEVEIEAMESGDDVREYQSRYEHIAGDLTIIIPYQTLLAAGGHLKAVAVRPRSRESIQAEAQGLVDRFGLSLFSGEPGGTYLYHASDTMSYSGVPNIIIPLIISIFIVLNTMIGSVYERKREIGIYTSVGLAPSHVSFLFIAEAMAFAVLSVVFGYLLAQTSAKLFAETALWSGITVNYSSMAGVAAMILVIVVVLVSVIYPSKVAGEIAIPDVNRSWTLPPARGNQLELTLPFLMTYREHRSVGGFLYDYFEGHQDVTHGTFSTANVGFGFACPYPPRMKAVQYDCPEGECEFDECLQITSRVWLAPFDFGIMQSVDFWFKPAEDEPGFLEIEVRLGRESGEANAWRRINKTFLHEIRRQLLLWRSFDDSAKLKYERLLTDAQKELGYVSDQVSKV